MLDYVIYDGEKIQNNYLKHIDCNYNNISKVEYFPDQYSKVKGHIVN